LPSAAAGRGGPVVAPAAPHVPDRGGRPAPAGCGCLSAAVASLWCRQRPGGGPAAGSCVGVEAPSGGRRLGALVRAARVAGEEGVCVGVVVAQPVCRVSVSMAVGWRRSHHRRGQPTRLCPFPWRLPVPPVWQEEGFSGRSVAAVACRLSRWGLPCRVLCRVRGPRASPPPPSRGASAARVRSARAAACRRCCLCWVRVRRRRRWLRPKVVPYGGRPGLALHRTPLTQVRRLVARAPARRPSARRRGGRTAGPGGAVSTPPWRSAALRGVGDRGGAAWSWPSGFPCLVADGRVEPLAWPGTGSGGCAGRYAVGRCDAAAMSVHGRVVPFLARACLGSLPSGARPPAKRREWPVICRAAPPPTMVPAAVEAGASRRWGSILARLGPNRLSPSAGPPVLALLCTPSSRPGYHPPVSWAAGASATDAWAGGVGDVGHGPFARVDFKACSHVLPRGRCSGRQTPCSGGRGPGRSRAACVHVAESRWPRSGEPPRTSRSVRLFARRATGRRGDAGGIASPVTTLRLTGGRRAPCPAQGPLLRSPVELKVQAASSCWGASAPIGWGRRRVGGASRRRRGGRNVCTRSRWHFRRRSGASRRKGFAGTRRARGRGRVRHRRRCKGESIEPLPTPAGSTQDGPGDARAARSRARRWWVRCQLRPGCSPCVVHSSFAWLAIGCGWFGVCAGWSAVPTGTGRPPAGLQ